MEKEKLESMLIDYLDKALSEADRKIVDEHLASNVEARQLWCQLQNVMSAIEKSSLIEPSAELQVRFERALAAEIKRDQPTKPAFLMPSFYKVAAAVGFVIMSIGLSYWISKNQQQANELALLKAEMDATKKMLMTMLENHQSASQRVQAATIAYMMEKPDYEVVNALVKAMNEDPNTNVRLSALDALGKFYQEEPIRKILIRSLAIQKDEVVQIALIQLLVKMKERSIVKELEKITTDGNVLKAVKDEAFTGILKLS